MFQSVLVYSTTINISHSPLIPTFQFFISIDEDAHFWINSDEKSKKFILENIEIVKNLSVGLNVENNLDHKLKDHGECLVLSMKKKTSRVSQPEERTLFLKSLKCSRQASAICVLDTTQRKAMYKRTKFPCIPHKSKLRPRRESDGINPGVSTTLLQNHDWKGTFARQGISKNTLLIPYIICNIRYQ